MRLTNRVKRPRLFHLVLSFAYIPVEDRLGRLFERLDGIHEERQEQLLIRV